MNKKISFPLVIISITVLAVLVAGIVVWQYLEITKEKLQESKVEYLYPVQWVQDNKMVVFNENYEFDSELDDLDDYLMLTKGYEETNKVIIVRNCEEYFWGIKEDFYPMSGSFNLGMAYFFEKQCIIPKYLSTATSSNISYINDFVLDENSFKNLPAAIQPIGAKGVKPKDKKLTWGEYNKSIRFKEKESDFYISLEDNSKNYGVSIIGRGDFNQDGIEDLFIKVSFKVKDGTLTGEEYTIITRLGPSEPIISLGEVDLEEIVKQLENESIEDKVLKIYKFPWYLSILLPIDKDLENLSFNKSSLDDSFIEFYITPSEEISIPEVCSSKMFIGWVSKEDEVPEPPIGVGQDCVYKCDSYLCFWPPQASWCDYGTDYLTLVTLEDKLRTEFLESLKNAECL